MKVFPVLGFHRSGTSLTSMILHRLGVNMGKRMLPPNDGNKKGFYENADFVKLNDRILDLASGSWFDPPSRKHIFAAGDILQQPIYNCINRNKGELWGWKDPRTCLTYLCYEQCLRGQEINIINVRRSKESVWRSFHARRKLSKNPVHRKVTRKHFDKIYEDYESRIIDIYEGGIYKNFYIIAYEDLLQGQGIRELIHMVIGRTSIEDRINYINMVRDIIDPGLRRF